MKNSFLIGLILFTVNLLFTIYADKPDPNCIVQEQKESTAKVTYTCSMHPEVIMDKAGKCPKCGMNLIAREKTKESYICPMHKEVKSDKAGKCTKCGMNLVKQEQPVKEAKSK